MAKKKRKPFIPRQTYNVLHAMFASDTEPMPESYRIHHLASVFQALHNMQTKETPTVKDWQIVSDALNMTETMIKVMKVCEDQDGLLKDATEAMINAGLRKLKCGQNIRFSGPELKSMQDLVTSYAEIINTISHRDAITAHYLTEKRLIEIKNGARRPGDYVMGQS